MASTPNPDVIKQDIRLFSAAMEKCTLDNSEVSGAGEIAEGSRHNPPAASPPASELRVPAIIKKSLHPKGLRAFPVEIRQMIFEGVMGESDKVPGDSKGLLTCLYFHDGELYQEALKIYYKTSALTIVGGAEWEAVTIPHLEEKVKMSAGSMQLVRKLHIKFYASLLDVIDNYDEDFRFGFHQHLKRLSLPNVQELTIDLSNVEDGVMRYMRHHSIVRYMVRYFSSLKKVSVAIRGGQGYRYEEVVDFVVWVPVLKYVRHPKWYRHWPEHCAHRFEQEELLIIQQALEVNPKLASIRPVTDGTDANSVKETCFFEHVYNENAPFPVTWFWEAEKGKTLVWRDGDHMGGRKGKTANYI